MANKTIEEIKAEAAVVRDATEEGENTALRVGTVMIDMIDTLSESVSINAIKGYVVIDSTSELPEEPTPEQQQKGYLLNTTLYVYVGEGGDTLDGKYQSAELKGADGAPGPQGPKGDSGVDLGEVVLVNDLTTGGEGSALTAEMGKYLNEGSSQNYIKGFYIDQTNKLVFRDTWNHYPDYFPCSQGDSLVWTPGVSLTLARLVFYNSNKEIVTSYTANAAQRTITAPANTAYVRISFNDMYGDVANTMPLKIGDVEYPRTEDKVGVKDIPITHIPNAIANNLYGYLYNHFGITDVPADAMLYENKTIQGTTVSLSGTRCIAQLPVNFGYGIRIIPTSGYKIDLRLCTYEQVDSGQISATTIISTNGVTTNPITALIPHGAHMAVIWVAKTTDAALTTEEAKLGFTVQMVKIPDVPRMVKSVNHRGYGTCPENTLVAFQESRRQGFFCVETDVRTTSDGVLVLLHDASINRTARNADGTAISGTVNIADITYQQALEYDFGIAAGSQFAGTKIPTLAQFLSLCKRLGMHAYLEYKDADVSAIVTAVQNAGMRGNVTYLGNQIYLRAVKALDTKARLAMLAAAATPSLYNELKNDFNEVIADMSYNDSYTTLKEAGIPVEVYVVDNTTYLDNMDSYISGVTSNKLVADRYLYLSEIL